MQTECEGLSREREAYSKCPAVGVGLVFKDQQGKLVWLHTGRGQVEGDEDREMGVLAVQNPKELIPPLFQALNSPNPVPSPILLC